MKKILIILIILSLFTLEFKSQVRDSLIQLYSGIGDTIDYVDREIFELYQNIDGYEYAQLYSRDKNILVSKIVCTSNSLSYDTLLIQDITNLSDMRSKLSLFIVENDKRFDSPPEVFIFTSSGNSYEGKLDMFSKQFFFLTSNTNYVSEKNSSFKFKTPIANVDSVMIGMKKNMLPYVGGGAFLGFLSGFLIGTATFEDDMGADKEVKWAVSGAIGALVGTFLGWLIGESVPNDYQTIQLYNRDSIIKLKDFAAYDFQYNKSSKEKYVEVP